MLYPKEDKENKRLLYAVSFSTTVKLCTSHYHCLLWSVLLLNVHYNVFVFTSYMQCRNCDYSQPAENNCIYVNKIMHEVE